MKLNNIEMTILVKGRPITEYLHRGQVFVEGRDNSEYEIEIRNNTSGRIEAVLSVDGLSVIDGKAAGAQSSGYLIEAHRTVKIPGWTLDNANVAKFAFAGKNESYSTQMTGDSRNNGVIGVMAFAEKYSPPQYYNQYNNGIQYIPNHGFFGINSLITNNNSNVYGFGAATATKSHATKSRGIASSEWDNYNSVYNASASMSPKLNVQTSNNNMDEASFSEVQNSLGTAFGESATFATTKVEFTRGDLLSMMVVYYDEARGLKARGIKMSKPKYQKVPDAFPAMSPEGCVPPPGWRK